MLPTPYRNIKMAVCSVTFKSPSNAGSDSRMSTAFSSYVLRKLDSTAIIVGAGYKSTSTAETDQPNFISQPQLRQVGV